MVRLFMMPPRLLIPRQVGRVRPSFHRARVQTRVVDYSTTTRLVHATVGPRPLMGPGPANPRRRPTATTLLRITRPISSAADSSSDEQPAF